jgi:hypothetical protein
MHVSTPDSKHRLYLGKLVSRGETWSAVRIGDQIQIDLVRPLQRKGRPFRLEDLDASGLRDLVRFARLDQKAQAAAIRKARPASAVRSVVSNPPVQSGTADSDGAKKNAQG